LSAPDPPVARFFTEIGIIDQLATNLFTRTLPEGLTPAQFGVLNHLARLGGSPTPTDLARAFQVAKQTMTSTLTRLEATGLVAIAGDARDRRVKHVTLTAPGRLIRDRAYAAMEALMASARALPTDSEVEPLLEPLRAIRERLDAARAPGQAP
jgi:DNA-binding MarR family transcriptional regulator